jgi:hypothetical protein
MLESRLEIESLIEKAIQNTEVIKIRADE